METWMKREDEQGKHGQFADNRSRHQESPQSSSRQEECKDGIVSKSQGQPTSQISVSLVNKNTDGARLNDKKQTQQQQQHDNYTTKAISSKQIKDRDPNETEKLQQANNNNNGTFRTGKVNQPPNETSSVSFKTVLEASSQDKQQVYFIAYDSPSMHARNKRNVYTFVRPSPKKTSTSSSYRVSRTRKFGALAGRQGCNSDPYLPRKPLSPTDELRLLEKSIRCASQQRVFEGGRLLFCKKRLKKEDQCLLSPSGSPSQEDVRLGRRSWSDDGNVLSDDRTCLISKLKNHDGIAPISTCASYSANHDCDDKATLKENVLSRKNTALSVSPGLGKLARQKSFDVVKNSAAEMGNNSSLSGSAEGIIDRENNTLSLLRPIEGILDSYGMDVTLDETTLAIGDKDDGNSPELKTNDAAHHLSISQSGDSFLMSFSSAEDEAKPSTISTIVQTKPSALKIPVLIHTTKDDAYFENKEVYQGASSSVSNDEINYDRDNEIRIPDDVPSDRSNDVITPVTSDEMFSTKTSSKGRSSGYSSSYLCVTGTGSFTNERRLSDFPPCASDLAVTMGGQLTSSSEKTFVKSSASISAPPSLNDISDNTSDVTITIDNKSVSESTTLFSVPRGRIKLALTTEHAGIYVTGDSQDDPTQDPETRRPVEKCPSWLGDKTGSSLFLSPSFIPNQPKECDDTKEGKNTVVVYEKKSKESIFFSTRQVLDPVKTATSTSSPLLTTQYKQASSSVPARSQTGNTWSTERSTSALLSPSFRKIQDHGQGWTKRTDKSSSGDSARSSFKGYDGDAYRTRSGSARTGPKGILQRGSNDLDLGASFPPRGGRKTTVLTPPTHRSRANSQDAPGSRTSSTYLSPYNHSSISSEADSGLDTPRSFQSMQRQSSLKSRGSRKSQCSQTRFFVKDRCPSKNFSTQSVHSGSSCHSVKTKSNKSGSFLSLISPKKLFGKRKNSDQSARSSTSKTSRKRLSDFPDDGKINVINVSGRRFKLHEYFTSIYPETLLGSNKRKGFYDSSRDEFFFDHDPDVFRHIWNFYYTGKLHYPRDECVELFIDELKFFGIPDEYICTCCWEDEYDPAKEKLERIREENRKRQEEEEKKNRRIPHDATLREKIWLTTKDPMISLPAKLFYLVSVLAIVLSTFANVAETVTCTEGARSCHEDYKKIFFYIDSACVIFFTLEYALKVSTAPKRWVFVRKFMSIIDLLAILPYYGDLVLRYVIGFKSNLGIEFLEILRILRIVRIFKLLRHSRRLQDLTQTVRGSTTELGLILFIYFVLVIVFSSVMYYAEMQDNPKFVSIPEAMWYAVITTTTTGYGDIVPETALGKVIGSACCILGVLVVALPVPILQIK